MKSSLQSFFASPAASILLVILGLPSASSSQDQQPTAAEMGKNGRLRTASHRKFAEVRSPLRRRSHAGELACLSPGGRKIQERKAYFRVFRNAHLRGASQARGMRELRVRR